MLSLLSHQQVLEPLRRRLLRLHLVDQDLRNIAHAKMMRARQANRSRLVSLHRISPASSEPLLPKAQELLRAILRSSRLHWEHLRQSQHERDARDLRDLPSSTVRDGRAYSRDLHRFAIAHRSKSALLVQVSQSWAQANLVEHLTKQLWRKLSSLQQQERCAATTWRENVSSFALFS